MGSEHYCLRWNNHQSNLLGVFSQLLQDESLVDVTLACSEGASIRAHKVVLSACSSYFQTLFLDHPGRHPIVILKDVEYPELRTLVEFMYKGEVNVQYCQLSALLKTAESLKVKGLAEMTNQSTALRETEREQDRLRPHSIPTKSEPLENATSSSAAVAAAAAAAVTSSSSLLSSSTIKLTATNTTATTTATSSSSILTLPPIRQESERSSPTSPPRLQSHSPTPLALYQKKLTNRDREHHLLETRISPHDDSPFIPKEERASSPDDDGMSNDVGLNMSLNSNAIHSAPPSCVIPPPVSSISTDLRPSSRGGLSSICIGNNGNSIRDIVASGSGLPSPMSEPLPGPSGMGPVQQVPLSLKKEIEWDRHDDKMIGSGESSSSDFRHPLDSMDEHNLSGYRNSFNTHLNRVPLPFAFPFAPLGLGLFDTDPSRILSLLHHQTLLAEEALRYRGVFLNPKETMRYNPLAEMLAAKDQDNRRRHQLPTQRDPFRLHHGIPDLIPASTVKQQLYNDEVLSKRMQCDTQDIYSVDESRTPSRDSNQSLTSKDIIDEILSKRGGSYLKEGIRFNPFSLSKDKSINPTSTSCSSPSAKTIADSVLLQESALSNEDETKCTICNASFPSMWLLEQHQALQHSSGTGEEKNFMSDSFRSAFAKHRDQSQRSRLPADKLFTCDVCGMQFRYLKSFKKHRLNHALERIHGKKNSENNNEMVTSSNESVEDNIDLNGMIKDEEEEEEDDNEMIDSMSRDDQPIPASSDSSIHSKITSSDMEITSQITGPAVGGSGIGSIKVKAPSFLQKYDVESSMPTTSMSHLLRPDTTIGLNPQETSLLNYLRADAADKQRERGTSASRFACPFCGKCVRSKENLKLHVRKHTGERPFVCLFCGRAFGGKSDLTRHLRIHTGERPYHCEACGKCFARADYLSKHLTTHLHNTSR